MAHFAKLDATLTVIGVISAPDSYDGKELELCVETGQTYRQCSYNTLQGKHLAGGKPFRGNYPSLGFTYDPELDGFFPHKPHPSWVKDATTFEWKAPVEYPEPFKHQWDETNKQWVDSGDPLPPSS